jgi:hypothetical protein
VSVAVPLALPAAEVSAPIADAEDVSPVVVPVPELIVEVESALTEVAVESVEVVELPSPHAAKAPIANTKSSFFMISLFMF